MTGVTDFIRGLCLTLLLSTNIHQGDAVRCFRCDHNEVAADTNFVIRWILEQLSKVSNPQCKMMSHENRYDVDVIECPPVADSGMKYVCGTVRGTVTTSVKIVTFDWNTVVRDCVQVPAYDPEYDNKCTAGETVSGPLKYLLEKAVETVDNFNLDSDVAFRGETCYDTNVVPEPSGEQQCASCTWNKLETEAAVLGPVLEIFSKLSEDVCKLENPDDKYQVAQRICPEPSSGQRAVCGVINGEVTTTFLGLEFKYKTLERGCVEEPRAEPYTSCQTELPSSGAVRDLANRGLQSLNLGEASFEGKICFNLDGFGNVGASHQGRVVLVLLTTILAWVRVYL